MWWAVCSLPFCKWGRRKRFGSRPGVLRNPSPGSGFVVGHQFLDGRMRSTSRESRSRRHPGVRGLLVIPDATQAYAAISGVSHYNLNRHGFSIRDRVDNRCDESHDRSVRFATISSLAVCRFLGEPPSHVFTASGSGSARFSESKGGFDSSRQNGGNGMSAFDQQVDAAKQWFASPRFAGIVHLSLLPREVAEQQGTISNDYPLRDGQPRSSCGLLRTLFQRPTRSRPSVPILPARRLS